MLHKQPTQVRMSVVEFDAWVAKPENADRLFELIDGFVYEKNTAEDGRMVAHFDSSEIAQIIGYYLRDHLMQHPIGRLSDADGGYEVGDQRYIPDIGFIRKTRFPKDYAGGYVKATPDLAVEVISATDREPNILIKLSNYLAVKTVVWIVYPEFQQVQVHTPEKTARILTLEDTLDGSELLPDFTLSVRDIFKPLLDDSEEDDT
ncbi:MAG: Uma2 family endonuclease [Chloroflexota bacterium]